MLLKNEIAIGQRVRWQAVGTRQQAVFGTIIDLRDEGIEVLILWDDSEGDHSTFIYSASDALHSAE